MKAYKTITTTAEQEIDVPEGVYFFVYTTEDELELYKRVTIKPKDEYEVITVCIEEGQESIKNYNSSYDFDWNTERLFTDDAKSKPIDADFFYLNYNEALHFFKSLQP